REMRSAYARMTARVGAAMTGAVVQAMAGTGPETIIGVVQDRSFGPLLMFGTGGVDVELFADQAFRALPITDLDAAELVRTPKGSARLFGHRGAQPVDVASLEAMVMKVARLAEDLPEVAEMDLNPVIVTARGAVVVDARIRVERPGSQPDPTLRRLQ
ncbi:MAG TPA: acetate--CoA ligase family protein, partial [Pseudonocardiaceae bacterium]|nr:acetate--CoA ligase family protein [Pseudonocardiaceae bacterium]